MAEQSSNYFGTFLETMQSKESAGETGSVPITLVHVLEERGPLSVMELQAALQLDILSLSKALETMTEAQLVQLYGSVGSETVSLTQQGHRLAEMQSAFA